MTDDEHGIAGPPEYLGFCETCGREIEPGESYERREETNIVRGRIGNPDPSIVNTVRGRVTWTCCGCLAARSTH